MADSQELDAVPRKPRRRWLQISLRTLLILVTLLSIGLGLIVTRGERQRRAVVALKELGAAIYYERPFAYGFDVEETLDRGRWLPRDYYDDVDSVHLSMTDLKDADLVHLKELNRLRSLLIDYTDVTDAGLAHIQDLTRLEILHLNVTFVTDGGLVHLQGMTSLRSLDVSDTDVTEAGVARLQRMLPKCRIRNYDVR